VIVSKNNADIGREQNIFEIMREKQEIVVEEDKIRTYIQSPGQG
jgi:hypothetical protein